MISYFLIFLISYILSFFAEKSYKKNRKISFLFFSALSILFPSFMAGIRASGIGTDTTIYVDWVFRVNVSAGNILDVLSFISSSGIEPLYCLLNYLVSRFTDNLSVIYFTLEFIILFFVYFSCVNMSKDTKFSFSYSYLIFLLLFFNKSLNLCRQSISMAICLYSLKYIFSRNWKMFILLFLISVGFHNSAILFIPLYFVYPIIINETNRNKIIRILIILVLIIVIIFFKQILHIFIDIGLLSSRYNNYISKYGGGNNVKIIVSS